MKTLLKNLYDCFYTPPEFSEQKQEVEECHQALIKVLEKPERRLVLRIMDAQSQSLAVRRRDRALFPCPEGRKQHEETNHHGCSVRRLSGPVCRCVASE